ncbi:glycosyltransferase family 4 protein [Roseateles albus]|uniref:Glycosyltransferase family 1 protein n=1 Tax=Roseateles albus TaxID=2987525 RepID=A0ABT5KFM8_9BURK|nr:glycosyltransferase family 1 protein [Roseateles albus]MDC8772728.1 glycosyltransferase family 1 protein [Roseateles albus]
MAAIKRKQCLFINGKFTAQRMTGVQRVAEQLVRELDQTLEAPAELLCPPSGGFANLQNITVRVIGPRWLSLTLWEQLILPFAARTGSLLNLAGAAPALARKQYCVMHDAAIFDQPDAYAQIFLSWYRWLFRRLVARAQGLFTVSNFSRDRLSLALGVPDSTFVVLGLGSEHLSVVQADENILANSGLTPNQYFLAVASQNPTKNMQRLALAFAALRPSAIKFVLVGGGNSRVFSGDDIDEEPGMLTLGAVSDEALVALYRGALGFVFPSIYEGFGLPPLEAMALGCPVIAARAASLPEVCADAVLYCDPLDIESIAAALQRLIDEPLFRQELRQRGFARARMWTWASAGERLRAGIKLSGAAP